MSAITPIGGTSPVSGLIRGWGSPGYLWSEETGYYIPERAAVVDRHAARMAHYAALDATVAKISETLGGVDPEVTNYESGGGVAYATWLLWDAPNSLGGTGVLLSAGLGHSVEETELSIFPIGKPESITAEDLINLADWDSHGPDVEDGQE